MKKQLKVTKHLKKESYKFLFVNSKGKKSTVLESEFIKFINPKGGVQGLNQVFHIMLQKIYPIAVHIDTERCSLRMNDKGFLLGLYWSRQLGHPVSIVLSKRDLSDTDATTILDEWLGWTHGSETIYKKDVANVHIQCFKEELSPEQFVLPQIS